jgi:hypothetical protein
LKHKSKRQYQINQGFKVFFRSKHHKIALQTKKDKKVGYNTKKRYQVLMVLTQRRVLISHRFPPFQKKLEDVSFLLTSSYRLSMAV